VTTLDRQPLLEFTTDDTGLAALSSEWGELLTDAYSPGVFQTWAWISSWRETLGSEHDLLVGSARDPRSGRLLGLAPFAVETRRVGPLTTRVLRMAGSGPAAPDHLDLIVRHGHPHVAAPLWEAISGRRTWDLIDLDGLRPGSRLAGLMLRRKNDRRDYSTTTMCPLLPLPSSWEEYQASLGRNLRQNLRRYARKLDAAHDTVVERMVVHDHDVTETVERLAEFHQQIRTARGDKGSFADPRMIDFHRTVAQRFLEAGRLRLHRLDVDGRMAAAISCFRHGDTVSFYTTGYDQALAAYGPGRRVLAAAIRGAIDEGASHFDFLRGDEEYKRSWLAVDTFDEHIQMPAGARGRLISQARGAVRPFRRLRGRLQRNR